MTLTATRPKQLWEVRNGDMRLHFHEGQAQAWLSEKRFIWMLAGTQGGKTSFGPHWLHREIQNCGPGDYLAVTSTFPLLKLKMLPEFLSVFDHALRLGEWKAADRVFQFHDGITRVIFGSATHPESLESATAKAAWLDECLAPETLISTEIGLLPIGKIVNDGLPLRVWAFDLERGEWQLRPIIRRIKRLQRATMVCLGPLRLTPNHKIWTREAGYLTVENILSAWYNTQKAEGVIHVQTMRTMPEAPRGDQPEALLQSRMLPPLARSPARIPTSNFREAATILREPRASASGFRTAEIALFRSVQPALASIGRRTLQPSTQYAQGAIRTSQESEALAEGRQWSRAELAAREVGSGIGVGERICSDDWPQLVAASIQDRCSGADTEDRYRGWEPSQSAESTMVCGEWLDISALLEPDGRNLDGGLSSDGYVYNLEVVDNHNYVANGILVANCGQDQFRLESWDAIQRRLSIYEGRVLGSTTLYNLGWLKQQVYDAWRNGDPEHEVIQFESILNPAFPRTEYERQKAKQPTWKFNMFYRGQYARPDNLIYSDFVDAYHEEGGHKVHPFNLPPVWPRHFGGDPGAVNTATLWIAHDPQADVFYVYRESLEGNKITREHAQAALEAARGLNVVNWRLGSKSELQQRLDWRAAGVPVQEPDIVDVEAGIDRVIALFKTLRLYVFDTCKGLLDELGTYSREMDDAGQMTEKIKDKETFHHLDALRYVAQALEYEGPQQGIVYYEDRVSISPF